jgi:hypothetical protein
MKRPSIGFNKRAKGQPKAPLVWRTGLSGVPPDMSGAPEDSSSNSSPSGNSRGNFTIIHRTVRCTPDCPVYTGHVRCSKEERPQELASLGNSFQPLRYNSPDCPVYTGLSGVTTGQRLLQAPTATCSAFIARQRAQRSCTPMLAHRTPYSTCPVRHRTSRRAQKTELQRSEPNGFGAHRTVRCTTRQPACTKQLVWWLGL